MIDFFIQFSPVSADSQIDGLMINKYEGRIVRIGRVV